MSHGRPDLRLDAPVLEPSEDLVQRLAATARASHVPHVARRHRVAIVAASFLGVSAISVGGAWAVGAIDLPGVPSSPLKQEIAPESPAPDRPEGESGTDPAAELPPGLGDPSPAGGGGRLDEPPAAPQERAEPRGAAPKDPSPGQGQTRREEKGDNGKHLGQEKNDPPGQDQGRQNGNGRGQEKKDRGEAPGQGGQRQRGDSGG